MLGTSPFKFAIVILVGSLFAAQIYFDHFSGNTPSTITRVEIEKPLKIEHQPVPADEPVYVEVENTLTERTHQSIEEINPELAFMLADQDFHALREKLLQLAAEAVDENNKIQLGEILNLLGQVSIEEQDLDAAEVYLSEALDIFTRSGDELNAAQSQLQLGRVHLKTRQIARVAGTAYDQLQIGRWQLANNQLYRAEQNILGAIESNLSINRFGAAAGAYESLGKLYGRHNDTYQMEQAIFEAARLYASSGQVIKAKAILADLADTANQQWQHYDILQEIDSNYHDFQSSVKQIERARDFRRLYNYYRTQGDLERAWKFRLLANASLSKVSKRAMFHRMKGVLAILYNSNDSMDLAEDYFSKAKQTFDTRGLAEFSDQVQHLNQQIY